LENFTHQELISQPLFIEFEDICDVRSIQDYGFPLWTRKRKRKSITVGNSEIIDCLEYLENIEVYKQSSHEEEKPFKTSMKMNIFLHSTVMENANDEKKKKKIASSNFPLAT